MEAQTVQMLQLAINGVSVGAIYALVALGLTLTYKATEVLNFAHGDVLMLASFIGWGLITGWQWSFWLALPATLLLVGLATWGLERGVMRRIAGQPQFAGVMLTIGLAFMIRGAVSMGFGPESRKFETPFSGNTTHVGPLVVADLNLAILGAVLAVTVALFLFLTRSTIVAVLGKGAVEGLYGIGGWKLNYPDSAPPEAKKVMEAYKKKFNTDPDENALNAYSYTDWFIKGLQAAGRNLTAEGFVKAQAGVSQEDFTTYVKMSFSGNHAGPEMVEIDQVKGGRWVSVTKPMTGVVK